MSSTIEAFFTAAHKKGIRTDRIETSGKKSAQGSYFGGMESAYHVHYYGTGAHIKYPSKTNLFHENEPCFKDTKASLTQLLEIYKAIKHIPILKELLSFYMDCFCLETLKKIKEGEKDITLKKSMDKKTPVNETPVKTKKAKEKDPFKAGNPNRKK